MKRKTNLFLPDFWTWHFCL